MKALLLALGVFGGATILSRLLSSGEGGRVMGELGRGWRGHSNSSRPRAYWAREMDTTTARYLMSSKIRDWGHHTIDNV